LERCLLSQGGETQELAYHRNIRNNKNTWLLATKDRLNLAHRVGTFQSIIGHMIRVASAGAEVAVEVFVLAHDVWRVLDERGGHGGETLHSIFID
jgi:hypothetical protein